MTATPSARAWELLRAALDLPPSQREAFVRKSCGDDAALRAEAMTLLSADGDVDSVLDTPLDPERILTTATDASVGTTIGGYRLLDQIGRGGMGSVYRAERVGGVTHHHVALKVIKRGMDSDEVVRRFVREREILAQLKHPNIARLIDGGVSERGQIWFAMELVDGAPITTWCDAHRLPIDRRIELFLAVCSAVQYAHRNLIVHRDLKPSNILVGGEGETKLLDFGIAKVLEEGGSGEAFTRSQMKMLTPDFAAPEQHRGEAVTTATDIYQLGLVLYELLCGRRALRDGNRSTAIPRLAAASTQLSSGDIDLETIAAARAQSPTALRKSLQGDLDRIVHKALNEEPARRYESVGDFAQDLRRYLTGEPVQAVGDSLRYRAGKFVRRHRLGVAATVLIALAIAGGVAGTLWQAHQARLAAAKALAAAARAEQIKDFIGSVFSAADPYTSKRGSTTARDLLDTARARVDKELADQPEVAIELLNIIGKSYIEVEAIDPARDAFAHALELAEKRFPAPHHWRAASRFQLSRALESSMQIDEAMRTLDATIAELRDLGEPEVTALIDALQVRSSMFHDHRQRERALSDAREAMTLAEPRFGPGAPEYFVPLHAAAKLEEDPAKSFAMIERAYTLAREHYGAEKNPLLLDIADDYGHALGEAGRGDDAIRVLGDAVKTRRELFGEHNFRVAGDLNALGVEQLRGGHYQAALDALREAEEVFKQYSEAGPHMAMVSLGDVVQAELLSGDDVDAQRDAQAVMSGLSMMGAKSRTWLMAQVALGATQLRTHHASAAIATLRDALSGWTALAPTHRGAGLAHVWLAMAFAADRQTDGARAELALARTNLSASTFRGDQQLLAEAVAAIETPVGH